MRDLEEAGRSVVAAPLLPPTPIEHIRDRAHGRRRRGRVRAAGALATAVALIGGAVLVAYQRRSPATSVVAKHPTKPPAAKLPTDPELRAHLGLGAPRGWIPVDFGDARLWIPPTWKVVRAGDCPADSRAGWMSLGLSGTEGLCGSGTATLTISTLSESVPAGSDRRTINSFAVFHSRTGLHQWSAPALHVFVLTSDATSERVLNTLAPSARRVATHTAAQPVRAGWQRVTYNGITFAAPESWPTLFTKTEPICRPFTPSQISAGKEAPGFDCLYHRPSYLPRDGLQVDGNSTEIPEPNCNTHCAAFSLSPEGPGVDVSGHEGGPIWVRAIDGGPGAPPVLDVIVALHGNMQLVQIGLGRDGRVANAILHSIDTAPTEATSVSGCATQPDPVTMRESSPHGTLVLDHPVRALLCVYNAGEQGTEHLLGTAIPETGATARLLDTARSRAGIACPEFGNPWIGILHFEYRRPTRRTTIQVGSCLTGNEHGVVVTPRALEAAVERIAIAAFNH